MATAKKSANDSRTKQAPAIENDLNRIVARFQGAPTMPVKADGNPHYADFTNVMEYKDACDLVAEANAAFMDVPARIREYFGHDAANLMEFVDTFRESEDGWAEAHAMGIITELPRHVDEAVHDYRESRGLDVEPVHPREAREERAEKARQARKAKVAADRAHPVNQSPPATEGS